MDSDIEIISTDKRKRPEKSEVSRLFADSSKARELIDWKPKKSLREGLELTIEWFSKEENLKRYKLRYTV